MAYACFFRTHIRWSIYVFIYNVYLISDICISVCVGHLYLTVSFFLTFSPHISLALTYLSLLLPFLSSSCASLPHYSSIRVCVCECNCQPLLPACLPHCRHANSIHLNLLVLADYSFSSDWMNKSSSALCICNCSWLCCPDIISEIGVSCNVAISFWTWVLAHRGVVGLLFLLKCFPPFFLPFLPLSSSFYLFDLSRSLGSYLCFSSLYLHYFVLYLLQLAHGPLPFPAAHAMISDCSNEQ